MTLLFISSDARPRYAEDILTVVATPPGGIFQFRYETRYVAPDIQSIVGNGMIVGQDAVIAFGGKVGTVDAFIMPTRLASVHSAEIIAEALIIKFLAKDFPDVTSLQRDAVDIEDKGKVVLTQVMSRYGGTYWPAVARSDGLVANAAGSGPSEWNDVVSRLSKLSAFSGSFFIRLSLVYATNKSFKEMFSRSKFFSMTPVELHDGSATLSNRNAAILRCWFSRETLASDERRITVKCDDAIVQISSDDSYDITSRYDDIEFWLHPRRLPVNSRTVLSIRVPGNPQVPGDLTTRVSLPIVVSRPVAPRLTRGLTSAVGAGLIAAPAILGVGSSLGLRLLLAAAGALIVSLVAALSGTP
ncbi:hypothetical protein [Nocardia sp. NPDC049149]|uniref:hypothetical protein n=1 Tax=Nocardia sp. NPDC049149 TaxID=3364315 RepID=UPI003717EDF4